jgi:hypothetical protein
LPVGAPRAAGCWCTSPACGGWGKSLHSTSLSAEAPPPQPSPASGRGSAAVQTEPVTPLYAPHARAALAPRTGGCWRTSPACGGGRRALGARRVGSLSTRRVFPRRHPHPNPPPQAGEGAQRCKPNPSSPFMPRMIGRRWHRAPVVVGAPLPLAGEVDALVERGGWGKSLHSTSLSAEAPPPYDCSYAPCSGGTGIGTV